MPITPWYIGATRPTWQFTWTDDDGHPVDLTAATVTVRLGKVGQSGYPGSGMVTVTNAAAGQFTYAVSLADLPAEGPYSIQVTATYPDTTVLRSDPVSLRVLAAV
jgi:hypothetical protein